MLELAWCGFACAPSQCTGSCLDRPGAIPDRQFFQAHPVVKGKEIQLVGHQLCMHLPSGSELRPWPCLLFCCRHSQEGHMCSEGANLQCNEILWMPFQGLYALTPHSAGRKVF